MTTTQKILFNLGNNLTIRKLLEEDAEELFLLIDENRDHLRVWLPWLDGVKGVESQVEFCRSVAQQYERGEGFVCGVFLNDAIVGVTGYHPIRWANKSVEIGYWLAESAVGQGIMTRCVRVLIDHAFSELGLNRVAIPAAVENSRSRAIPERLGFKMEGILRDAEWLYDHYVDHAVYAMLKRDWEADESGDPVGAN